MIDFNIPVEEEIHYLANVLTDEQRKAIFAKMGGGGGSGGGTPTYTRADNHGTNGGRGGGSGVGSGMTVSTTRNGTSGGGYHYTGADDMTSSWVTSLSPDQMKEEFKNDPDRLRAAIEEQLRMGAYDGIMVNGHKPSVDDIINNGIAPNYGKEPKVLSSEEAAMLRRGDTGGAQAVALDPMTGKPLQEGQGSWAHLTPSQQVQQDITGGTGTTSTSGGGTMTTTPAGGGSTGTTTSGGGSAAPGDIGGAIGNIDVSGAGGGPTAAEIAAANLSAFQQALANAHF